MNFGQKYAYVRDFWPKTCVYREGSGKKKTKDQTTLGECQWMDLLKEEVKQETSTPRGTQPHSQPTQQLLTSKTKPEGRMCVIV